MVNDWDDTSAEHRVWEKMRKWKVREWHEGEDTSKKWVEPGVLPEVTGKIDRWKLFRMEDEESREIMRVIEQWYWTVCGSLNMGDERLIKQYGYTFDKLREIFHVEEEEVD